MMKHVQNLLDLLRNLQTLLGETVFYLKKLADERRRQSLYAGDPDQVWMDAQDLKAMLYISDRSLQRLRDTGELRFSKLHNKIYYKRSDVIALLEKHYS